MASDAVTRLQEGTDENQALGYHARERRASLLGKLELYRTHQFVGATEIAVPLIDGAAVFPNTETCVTFETEIRITSGSVVDQHRGLVFEFGDNANSTVMWVGDQTIGFRSGGIAFLNQIAAFTFDFGSIFPVGITYKIVAAVNPGTSSARMWLNGREVGRSTANVVPFFAGWAGPADGSFASLPQGALAGDIPIDSTGAPDGFDVIKPLSVYVGQVPRHFV